MHEVSIIQNVIQMAEEQARAQGAKRIHALRMRIGAMSGVVVDALEFAFEVVRRGTMADQAALEIETAPPRAWCAACRKEFDCSNWNLACPDCGEPSREIRKGTEVELVDMEIS
ncbi:MAG: hydrogenase maturation nickel metallochaperone HypA [Verrucomicrobia bacterium]|nr:hydrogenase maturation nickel metallochaperone HypA [Verrucomicrobiota bacterium]